jgi:transcriptional/translational regulatory protein YebC/TACO1
MFKLKGAISVAKSSVEEEKLMDVALEAGADDIQADGDSFEISTSQSTFEGVREALEKAGIKTESAEVSKVADNLVKVDGDIAQKVLRLMESLDELDDTQKVYSNADFSDEDIAKFSEEK